MEKIKFGEKSFTLITNGVDTFSDDKLTVSFQLGDVTLDVVETLVSDSSNTDRIEILDSDGELLRPLTGYTILKELKKVKDYPVETKLLEDGTEETTKADIAVVTLSKTDLREEVARNTANIEYLSMMTDVNLEA